MSSEQTVEIDAVRRELVEALHADLTERPQRCGHTSDPMCCPYENFPLLAAFFKQAEAPPEPLPPGDPWSTDPRIARDERQAVIREAIWDHTILAIGDGLSSRAKALMAEEDVHAMVHSLVDRLDEAGLTVAPRNRPEQSTPPTDTGGEA